jgi:hypothetical protein
MTPNNFSKGEHLGILNEARILFQFDRKLP